MSFTEYRNQNEYRSYPFQDNTTRCSTSGYVLPDNAVIDALLYPIDLDNALYLSKMDVTQGTMVFCDTVTDKVHGRALLTTSYPDTPYPVTVFEPESPYRVIGKIVLGAGIADLPASSLDFAPEATVLSAASYYPLNQPGVRGVLLPNGDFRCNDIMLRGVNGMHVTTYVDNYGRNIIRFDVVPDPASATIADCTDYTPVTCLRVARTSESLVAVSSHSDNDVLVSSYGFELDDICGKTNISVPAADADPDCDAIPECIDATPAEVIICAEHGRVYLSAISTEDYANPFKIVAKEEAAPAVDYGRVKRTQGLSNTAREDIIDQMFHPNANTRGNIIIGLRAGVSERRYV